MPGPIPKRDSERTRRNKTNDAGLDTKRGVARGVTSWPPASKGWAVPVKRMYRSFKNSGMSDFFEDTDVEMVWFACEGMQAHYDSGFGSPTYFQALWAAFGSMGGSEAERRRMRIELERLQPEITEEAATIAKMSDYKKRAQVGS